MAESILKLPWSTTGTKIIKTADVHLDVPGKLNDAVWGLRVIDEYANRNGINTTLLLGDLFTNRETVSIDALCAARDFFEEARQNGRYWITFPGNHDMFLKHSWTINSLRPLDRVLTVIDNIKILMIGDVRFWILPFIHLERAYMQVLSKIEEQYRDGDVLLTHIGVREAIKNTCFMLKDWGTVTFDASKFRQVYTGHFHSTQQVGANVWYPGSPIPFKADEGDCRHGFFVYDLQTRTHEFKDIWELGAIYFPDEIPPPNWVTVTPEYLESLTDDIAKHNIVRIAVDRDYTQTEKGEIREKLQSLGVKDVRWMELGKDKQDGPQFSDLSGSDVSDLFDVWLEADAQNIQKHGLDVGVLRKINAECVVDGDDKYVCTTDGD